MIVGKEWNPYSGSYLIEQPASDQNVKDDQLQSISLHFSHPGLDILVACITSLHQKQERGPCMCL